MAVVRDSLGSYTSPLRKSGENNFHKLERKRPGVQRVSELERHLMVIQCNHHFQTARKETEAPNRRRTASRSLAGQGSSLSRPKQSLHLYQQLKGEKASHSSLQRDYYNGGPWLAKRRDVLSTDALRPKILLGRKPWRGWDMRVRVRVCVCKGHIIGPSPYTFAHNNLMCRVERTLQLTLPPGTLGNHTARGPGANH